MTRVRLFGALAVAAVIAAGSVLDDRKTSARIQAPVASQPPSTTASPAIRPVPTLPGPATRVAEAFALAATNWSAATYSASCRRRISLAAPSLAAHLARDCLLSRHVPQLREDRTIRLGAVLRSDQTVAGSRTLVTVVIDEVHLSVGLRSQQTARYAVELARSREDWRISGFTIVEDRP